MSGEDFATGEKEEGMVVTEGKAQGKVGQTTSQHLRGLGREIRSSVTDYAARHYQKKNPTHTKTKENGKPIYIKKASSQTSTRQASPSNNWSFEAFYQ